MKENVILNHYKYLFENYLFDEYDLLGFLIFIRERINELDCPFIQEFCDLIAHRKRNKGIIKDNILNARNNLYSSNRNNKVIGYRGIKWDKWINEWKRVEELLEINFLKDNKKLLKEITICIFSLSQHTEYYDGDNSIGKVDVFIDSSKKIALITSENEIHSPLVCLMTIGPFLNINEQDRGFINKPLEIKRINNSFCLYCGDKIILKID